jgi:ubiquitin-conjugating enzyme E2 variant
VPADTGQVPAASALPEHGATSRFSQALELVSLVAAAALVLANGARFATHPAQLSAGVALAVIAGVVLADFASGIVHWLADTWGSESLPVLGPRFIRPFRVHHVNPEDLLSRSFLDCNGDVAMLAAPLLALALWVPLDTHSGACCASLFAALGTASLPTNQIHQWAHQPRPPRAVAWLQARGLILSRAAHARHHTAPYASHYCITTGWCNSALAALGFWRGLERAISRVTGLEACSDERVFAERPLRDCRS